MKAPHAPGPDFTALCAEVAQAITREDEKKNTTVAIRRRPGSMTPLEHTPLELMALAREPIPADMVPIVSQSLGRYYCLPDGWVLAIPDESRTES